jgi:hypothetical protein
MNSLMFTIILLLLTQLTFSCSKKADGVEIVEPPAWRILPGDIIVLNRATDVLSHYDNEGNYKGVLYEISQPNSVILKSFAWSVDGEELYVIYDHTTATEDKVIGISAFDGSVRPVIEHNELAGTLNALMVADNGDIIVSEGNLLERFTKRGRRIEDGVYPSGNLHTNTRQLTRLNNGDILMCSSGTDRVQKFDEADLTAGAFATSAIADPALNAPDIVGCMQGEDGSIFIALSGTQDAILKLDEDLTEELSRFRNTLLLGTPGDLWVDGEHVYVLETDLNRLIILDYDLSLIRVITEGIANPWNVTVRPTLDDNNGDD